jgi:hypothetical protein
MSTAKQRAKLAAYMRGWHARNRDKSRKWSARYLAANPNKQAEWRANQPPEYFVWEKMKGRCNRPTGSNECYQGVTVCERWRKSFAAFLADMGPRPSPRHSIDRWPNPNGNYEPTNCRWATAKEQRENRRIDDRRMIEFNGKRQCIAEWSNETKLP